MRLKSYAILIACLILPMQAAFAGEMFPRVVVTVPAITPYVDALLNNLTHAENLLRPGQDAHSFALSSNQRAMLARADIIILADNGMSPQLGTLLDAEAKRGASIIVLTALPGAQALPYSQSNPWLDQVKDQLRHKSKKDAPDAAAAPEEEPAEGDEEDALVDGKLKTDPHLWLDPVRMANLATPIAEAIAKRSPSHRALLLANANVLTKHLREDVDPALRASLQKSTPAPMGTKPYVPFITYHAAYQYFTTRYGMKYEGEIMQRPEDYIGAGMLHDVVKSAEHISIHCIISEGSTPLVQRIADASHAKIVVLSPEAAVSSSEISDAPWVRNDYDRLLQKTADSFAKCL